LQRLSRASHNFSVLSKHRRIHHDMRFKATADVCSVKVCTA